LFAKCGFAGANEATATFRFTFSSPNTVRFLRLGSVEDEVNEEPEAAAIAFRGFEEDMKSNLI
jgi:hypothetical protein